MIGTYERLHAGPPDSFERMKLEQRRALQKQPSSQNTKKAISVYPASAKTNSQQTQKKINLETPGKATPKIKFAILFHSKFRKSRSLRRNGQLKKILIIFVQKNDDISILNKSYDASNRPIKREP